MYSQDIAEWNIRRLSKLTGEQFVRHDRQDCLDFLARIPLKPDGTPSRPLSPSEQRWIVNEQHVCRLDFEYWATRYGHRFKDEGGVGPPSDFWTSQKIALQRLADQEAENARRLEKGDVVEGLRVVWHKARQLGATMFSRLLLMHRLTLYRDNRAMAASVDDDKKQELYDRDKLIYDNLPFFLKPPLTYDVKNEHLYFESTNGRVLYQQAGQKSGMGTGRQFELGHLTELSSWTSAHTMVEMDFFPTIPQHSRALVLLESTANGRGNWWHEFSEEVRRGWRPGWIYVFVPWYAEKEKYRRTPPDDWTPSEITRLHAEKVEETSQEFVGETVRLSKEKLYWYETEREAYQRGGKLNIFLSNWCATPEESFQHSGQSAFPPEFLEKARLTAQVGVPYVTEVRQHAIVDS